MKSFLSKNRRGIFYGFTISIGLIFLHEILLNAGLREFAVGAVILYFVFVFEIYNNWFYARKVLAQMEIPAADSYSRLSQITHHIILPTVFYISYLGIIYFYQLSIPRLAIFGFAFFSFSLLFINIRAYYEDKFKLEEKTHYIFDIIKFLAFFQLTTSILKVQEHFSLNLIYSLISISLVSFIIHMFVVVRHRQLGLGTFTFSLLFSLLISAVCYMLFRFTSLNNLAISSYLILVFYISSATIHHKLEGSFTKAVFIEYCVVLLLSLVILQGLTN